MRPVALALAFVIAGPTAAHADAALEEVSAGNVPQTASSPGSQWIADKVAAMWDPSDHWQLRADFSGTRDYSAQAPGANGYADPNNILLGTLGAEFDPGTHWNFRLNTGYSPTATTDTTTSINAKAVSGKTTAGNAQLMAESSTMTAGAQVGYDSAGDSNLEASWLLTATGSQIATNQQITSIEDKSGAMLTPQQVRDYCATHRCSQQLTAALDAQASTLRQLVLGGNMSAQLYQHTDIGVDGALYIYDKDPTQVGYFNVLGRATSLGGGVPIAPLLFTVAPDVVHRWGQLMALATFSYGKYVDNEGYNVTTALRVQYKFKLDELKRLKLWGKISGSRDTDSTNTTSKSGSVALGVQYAW